MSTSPKRKQPGLAQTSFAAAPKPTPKKMRFDFENVVVVLVGHHKHPFYVPRNLLRARSPVLKKACETSHTADLPEDWPEVFAAYLHILHTNEVVDSGVEDDPTDAGLMMSLDFTDNLTIYQMYVLAVKLEDYTTANLITDEIVRRHNKEAQYVNPRDIQWDEVAYVWKNVSQTTGLRAFMASFYALTREKGYLLRVLEDERVPRGFLADITRVLLGITDGGVPNRGRDITREPHDAWHFKD